MRGVAHLGVLHVLEREGIKVRGVAGVSVGALVGVAFAAGWSPERLFERVQKLRWRRMVSFSRRPLGESLLRTDRLRSILRHELQLRSFSDLQIPVALVATDLRTGRQVVLDRKSSDLELTDAILASSAVPGLFPPILKGSGYLVDGGVVNNLPVAAARALAADNHQGEAAVVVGVDLMAYPAGGNLPMGILESWQRSLWLMIGSNQRHEEAEITIRPAVGEFSFTDFSAASELFDLGARAAQEALPTILSAMGDSS